MIVNGVAIVAAAVSVIVIKRAARRFRLNMGDPSVQGPAESTILRVVLILLVVSIVTALLNIFILQ